MTPETWSAIADCVMAGAAVAASIAAVRGINSWRSQELWKQDRELARILLISLSHYEQAINALRSRFIFAHEMQDEENSGDGDSAPATRGSRLNRAYDRRWRRVQLARGELAAKLLEAMAIWPADELQGNLASLTKLENDLYFALTMYLELNDELEAAKDKDTVERRKILGEQLPYKLRIYGGKADDPFGAELAATIDAFRQCITPKLGRNR